MFVSSTEKNQINNIQFKFQVHVDIFSAFYILHVSALVLFVS